MLPITRRLAALAVTALVASACNCGGDNFKRLSITTITIEAPTPQSSLVTGVPTTFRAVAQNVSGLGQVSLMVGERELLTCPAGDDNMHITCEGAFDPGDFADQIQTAQITLTAVAQDAGGEESRKSITVLVKPIVVRFITPAPTEDGTPTVLTGPSPLEVEILSAHGVERAQVVFDGDNVLHNFTQAPFKVTIDWGPRLIAGEHRLVARARDTQGETADAYVDVVVMCQDDDACGEGTRCCVDKGTCHDIVGAGDLCDCERPCPESQGCFPGTCGQTPRRCRPGCFPGNSNVRADRCSDQDGRAAYCNDLPANERTDENRGGACAPADNCDVVQQNCPDLPLDRTRAVGPDNPAVPHNCVPVAPTVNACIPAGSKRLDEDGCSDECGPEGALMGCGKGMLCVSTVDQNYNVIRGPHCARQCATPNSFSGCGLGGMCGGLMGRGRETYRTGVCQ